MPRGEVNGQRIECGVVSLLTFAKVESNTGAVLHAKQSKEPHLLRLCAGQERWFRALEELLGLFHAVVGDTEIRQLPDSPTEFVQVVGSPLFWWVCGSQSFVDWLNRCCDVCCDWLDARKLNLQAFSRPRREVLEKVQDKVGEVWECM